VGSTFGPFAEPLEDRCLLSIAAAPVQRITQPLSPDTFVMSWEGAGRSLHLNVSGNTRTLTPWEGSFTLSYSDTNTTLVVVEDFNGDGLPDAIVNFGSTTRLLLGQADGSFGLGMEMMLQPDAVASLLLPGDFDRNGQPDILTVSTLAGGERVASLITSIGDQAFQVAALTEIPSDWTLAQSPDIAAEIE